MPNDVAPSVSDLHFLTTAEASRLIERRQLSPVTLTKAFIERIAAIAPQLNAYLPVTAEQALDQARGKQRVLIVQGRHPLPGRAMLLGLNVPGACAGAVVCRHTP